MTAPGTDGDGSTNRVLAALAAVLDLPDAAAEGLTVTGQRIAGRSRILFVTSDPSPQARPRWVVKQPNTTWAQDDLSSPVSARDEFDALSRLHHHFGTIGGLARVPAPVALLPEVGALAMEYVAGVTVRQLLTYRSLRAPSRLLNATAAAGRLLADLHTLELQPQGDADLSDEAHQVLVTAAEKLHPRGLALPARVEQTLLAVPAATVRSTRVRLHGDFGPGNVILADDGTTVGLDPALHDVGFPEDDLARFVALMSGSVRFAPELVMPPARRVRRRLETNLLRTYYGGPGVPALFELRYLRQLASRWIRARELVQQTVTGSMLPVRLRIVGAQMTMLMNESADRLARHPLGR
jgi:aminoglycoside phosphotransferase (APT) family kinase protein